MRDRRLVDVSVGLARAMDRVFDALRDRRAFAVTESSATDSELECFRAAKYALLVTYRRNGEPVPSPVWIALDEGVLYVKTTRHAGKVNRLSRDPRVLIAPSTMRGRPTGPVVRGCARLLPEEEWPRAEGALAAAYGLGRSASERLLNQQDMAAYIAITPDRSRAGSPGCH